ncbi:MAG: chemotaxis protein [Gammaproteobacteria bacterium]
MSGVMEGVDQRTQLVGRNRMELLLFRLGSAQRFGINVFKVREVIKCPPLTQIPQSHAVIRGIASIRGVTMSVIDLSAAIGYPPAQSTEGRFTVVAEYNRQILGFLVDSVERILNVRWEQVKPPPRGVGTQNYLTAVIEFEGELIEIIDVERVLADVVGFKVELDAGYAGAAGGNAANHVLFVDDSALARKQIQGVLEQMGLPYTMAVNGREALEKLLEMNDASPVPIHERVALVIADVEMPEMDGYTLTKNIKENPALRHLYVCLHTSLSGAFNHAMVHRVGADKLVSKFDPNDLAALISEVLATRRAAA